MSPFSAYSVNVSKSRFSFIHSVDYVPQDLCQVNWYLLSLPLVLHEPWSYAGGGGGGGEG